jgi:hypothetical protein
MDSIVLISSNLLTTNNIRYSIKPICVTSSLLKLLVIDIVVGYTCVLFLLGSWSNAYNVINLLT